MNLIINSIDAMKDGDGARELAIKSQREEHDQLAVCVSDTGVGLPQQQADQIFNTFFTTKPNGTGMGLSICRSIVELHSGRLWAADNLSSRRKFSLHSTHQSRMSDAPENQDLFTTTLLLTAALPGRRSRRSAGLICAIHRQPQQGRASASEAVRISRRYDVGA